MKWPGAVAVSLVLAPSAAGTEIHSGLCLYGCPAGSPATNDVVVRSIYVLSSNDTTKLADWGACRVTAATIGPTAPRPMPAMPGADEVHLVPSGATLERAVWPGMTP